MIKINKRFLIYFGAAFAATAVVAAFMVLVVFRGAFGNTYKAKGNAKLAKGEYAAAIEDFNTALSFNKKNQELYILLAEAYTRAEDYETAGKIIDDAIENKIQTDKNGLENLYMMRVKVLSAEGNLAKAVSYLESIPDQYILKKIQSVRPDDLKYTPTQGSYEKSLKMEIEVSEGETVYYTTDGSYPTKFSNTYVLPINIQNGTTKITAISVAQNGLVSPTLNVTYKVTNDFEAVEFDDKKVEKMVRNALNKPTGPVRVKELESITELTNDGVSGSIKTLSDLERMPALVSLDINGEKEMLSISHLSGHSQLKSLVLTGCALTSDDLNSIAGLSSLETLDLSNNNITSVTVLSNLTSLKHVVLAKNNIADISQLTSGEFIEVIDASENRLTAIPDYKYCESLVSLAVAKNNISDLSSIHQYKNLTSLDISKNAVTNAKNIAKLTNLETLNVSGNNITNFEFLSSLKNLHALDVSATSFMSVSSLSGLPLINLSATDTPLSSLSGISAVSTLTSIRIANSSVNDISPLAALTNLDYLDISNCKIKDVSPLKDLQNLYTLKAQNVSVDLVKFANPDILIVQ